MVLPALAAEAARRHGDREAFTWAGGSLNFRELDRASDEAAVGLQRLGIREGDLVALMLPTGPEYPVAYLAAAKAGAVTAGLNLRLPPVQRAAMLAVAAPRLILGGPGENAPAGAEMLTVEPTCNGAVLASLRVPDASPPRLRADPERPLAVVFTSGTTGTPKGALFRERQVDAVRATDVGALWGAGSRSVTGTSLAHLGFMTKLAGHLQSGATAHLVARWNAAEALELARVMRLSSLAGVPTQLALLLAEADRTGVELPALRTVVVGGGPVTPALVRRARSRFGVPVCTRYSCTEAGVGCGTGPGDPPEDAEVSVGRPQPGVELAVRDGAGGVVVPGDVGEVLLRSAAVMSGYWQDPAATEAVLTADGFVRTGDLGRVDEHGRLRLVGRSREIYVRGGYNVSPVSVEAALSPAPGVEALAVAPADDDTWGQVGVAFVVPSPDGPVPTLAQLREHGSAALARHELPERLVLVAALPQTPGDKVDRAALQALLAAGPTRD